MMRRGFGFSPLHVGVIFTGDAQFLETRKQSRCFSPLHVGVIFTGMLWMSSALQAKWVSVPFTSGLSSQVRYQAGSGADGQVSVPFTSGLSSQATHTNYTTEDLIMFQSPSRRGYLHRDSGPSWPPCASVSFSPLHVGVIFTGIRPDGLKARKPQVSVPFTSGLSSQGICLFANACRSVVSVPFTSGLSSQGTHSPCSG